MKKSQRKFISETELSGADADRLMSDPKWYRDQYGFYLRKSKKEIRKMSDEELSLYVNSEDDWTATAAKEEQDRRRIRFERRLIWRDKIFWWLLGAASPFALMVLKWVVQEGLRWSKNIFF